MKKQILTTLVIVLAFFANGQENIKYFRYFDYDKKSNSFIGKDSINEKTAKDTMCFRFTFNKYNKPEKIELLDKFKLFNNEISPAIVRYKYDIQGNNIEVSYYGANEKLKEMLGFAIIRYKYDTHGNIIETSFYGADEKLKENNGVPIYRHKYDDKGNKIEESHYGADNKLKEDKRGIAIGRFKYDDKGNLIELSHYGIDEKLKENDLGFAIIRYKYDSKGNKIEESTYDADEKLKENDLGYAIIRWKYDDNGKLKEVPHYGADGKQIKPSNNDSLRVYTFVDVIPQFPGGEEALYKYLGENVKYPQAAKDKGIQGKVFVSFVVEIDGSISEIKVLRGIGEGCDEEAVSVMKNMPKWIPGSMNGIPVRVQYNLPFSFTLTKD